MKIESIFLEKYGEDLLLTINTDEKGLIVDLLNNQLRLYDEDNENIYELDYDFNLPKGQMYLKFYMYEKDQILIYLKHYKGISKRDIIDIKFKSDIKYSSILELKDIAIRKDINLIKQIENDEQEKMNGRFNKWLNETWDPGDEYD